MKKICITFFLLFIISLTAIFGSLAAPETEYLRMHIRANSNAAEDQAVKYLVRDAVVEYLVPVAAECTSKSRAEELLAAELPAIERIADEVLRANGFSYTAKAALRQEEFPTRVYENYTLEAGIYDALILELGTGEGDNWWCVVYPPLCFSGAENVRYRSKILEIIESFRGST